MPVLQEVILTSLVILFVEVGFLIRSKKTCINKLEKIKIILKIIYVTKNKDLNTKGKTKLKGSRSGQ